MSVQLQEFSKVSRPVEPNMPYTKEAFLARKQELLDDLEKTKYANLTWIKLKTVKTINEILVSCFGC